MLGIIRAYVAKRLKRVCFAHYLDLCYGVSFSLPHQLSQNLVMILPVDTVGRRQHTIPHYRRPYFPFSPGPTKSRSPAASFWLLPLEAGQIADHATSLAALCGYIKCILRLTSS